MDKQQAAQIFNKLNLACLSPEDLIIAGWEAHEAQSLDEFFLLKEENRRLKSELSYEIALRKALQSSIQPPTDAVAKTAILFAELIGNCCSYAGNGMWLHKNRPISSGELYYVLNPAAKISTVNPSGAAPQAMDKKTKKEIIKQCLKKFDLGIDILPAVLEAVELCVQQQRIASAPPAVGPVERDNAILVQALEEIGKGPLQFKEKTPAGPVDYKDVLRNMMKETNGDLLIHIPEVSGTGRAKAQVIVMDEFFKTFPAGTDLEQLRKDFNEIKPLV